MRNYVPQPGWDESEEEELPRKRAKKDKDAPKRPRTAYILFSTEYRSGPCLWQLQQPAFQGLRMSPSHLRHSACCWVPMNGLTQ